MQYFFRNSSSNQSVSLKNEVQRRYYARNKHCIQRNREYEIKSYIKRKKEKAKEILEYAKKYYNTHRKEILLKRRMQYKEKNQEIQAYQKEYYKKNREKILEYQRQYKKKNQEENQAYQKEYHKTYSAKNEKISISQKISQKKYYDKNRKKILEYQKQYRKANEEKIRTYFRERCKKKKATYTQLNKDRKYVDSIINCIKISKEELEQDYKW